MSSKELGIQKYGDCPTGLEPAVHGTGRPEPPVYLIRLLTAITIPTLAGR
jgi:hypothetical protein